MNNQHPITPPRELVTDWCRQWADENDGPTSVYDIATQAAGWGADQELEACCDQLERWGFPCAENLHNTRRPKSMSLKEQALKQLECVDGILRNQGMIKTDTIRRALEALPDD